MSVDVDISPSMPCPSEVSKPRESAKSLKEGINALAVETAEETSRWRCHWLCRAVWPWLQYLMDPRCQGAIHPASPPLPFCQHLKGSIKTLVHSFTVPGRILPLLVSRLLLLSQISGDTVIATWEIKKIPGSALITRDVWARINMRPDWAPPELHPSARRDPCCHTSTYRRKNPLCSESIGDFCQQAKR